MPKRQLKRKAEPPPLSPEATARLAGVLERCRVRVLGVPGLVDDLQDMLLDANSAFGVSSIVERGMLQQALKTPLTLDMVRNMLQTIGRQLIERGIEIGREETLREYALEALAGAAEEEEEPAACSPVPLGRDTQLDADFEEA